MFKNVYDAYADGFDAYHRGIDRDPFDDQQMNNAYVAGYQLAKEQVNFNLNHDPHEE